MESAYFSIPAIPFSHLGSTPGWLNGLHSIRNPHTIDRLLTSSPTDQRHSLPLDGYTLSSVKDHQSLRTNLLFSTDGAARDTAVSPRRASEVPMNLTSTSPVGQLSASLFPFRSRRSPSPNESGIFGKAGGVYESRRFQIDPSNSWLPTKNGQTNSGNYAGFGVDLSQTVERHGDSTYDDPTGLAIGTDAEDGTVEVCTDCRKVFKRKVYLQRHMEREHWCTAKVFKCEDCAYQTKHQSNLSVHRRTHTGERPYHCGACGQRYTQGHLLKSHIRSRHGGNLHFYNLDRRSESTRGRKSLDVKHELLFASGSRPGTGSGKINSILQAAAGAQLQGSPYLFQMNNYDDLFSTATTGSQISSLLPFFASMSGGSVQLGAPAASLATVANADDRRWTLGNARLLSLGGLVPNGFLPTYQPLPDSLSILEGSRRETLLEEIQTNTVPQDLTLDPLRASLLFDARQNHPHNSKTTEELKLSRLVSHTKAVLSRNSGDIPSFSVDQDDQPVMMATDEAEDLSVERKINKEPMEPGEIYRPGATARQTSGSRFSEPTSFAGPLEVDTASSNTDSASCSSPACTEDSGDVSFASSYDGSISSKPNICRDETVPFDMTTTTSHHAVDGDPPICLHLRKLRQLRRCVHRILCTFSTDLGLDIGDEGGHDSDDDTIDNLLYEVLYSNIEENV